MKQVALAWALQCMGYRKLAHEKPIWGKPVGYSLFTVEPIPDDTLFTQWFVDGNNEIAVWGSHKFSDATSGHNYLEWLKYCENWIARVGCTIGWESHFEFATLADALEAQQAQDDSS